MANPHLRFVVKSLPKPVLVLTGLFTLGGIALFAYGFWQNPHYLQTLLGSENFSWHSISANLQAGLTPFFFGQSGENLWLSPLLGLAIIALALVGLFSTARGFFASRNALATCLLVATVAFTVLDPDAAMLLILPVAILVAHGFRYVLDRWYGLFPENPYARVFALLPMAVFVGLVLYSNLTTYIYGYRYTPSVASQFTNDLDLVRTNLLDTDTDCVLLVQNQPTLLRFYQILNNDHFNAVDSLDGVHATTVATLGAPLTDTTGNNTDAAADNTAATDSAESQFSLTGIITSPKAADSARIYIYNQN